MSNPEPIWFDSEVFYEEMRRSARQDAVRASGRRQPDLTDPPASHADGDLPTGN